MKNKNENSRMVRISTSTEIRIKEIELLMLKEYGLGPLSNDDVISLIAMLSEDEVKEMIKRKMSLIQTTLKEDEVNINLDIDMSKGLKK